MKKFFWLFIFVVFLQSCARVGTPIGGDKDTLAPVFLRSNIDTTRVNVPLDIKELRLEFDEYVKLKDIQKNLIISPPIKKIKKIIPSNIATKFISIQFEDTLKENTTYQFNFGNAIQDNNESNTLRYFNFAFSTGDTINQNYISGELKNSFDINDKKTTNANKNVVGLYVDSDSIDYRQKPYYLSKVDDDGYFELEYVTPGKYQLIAFSDDNENSIYDAGKEKIAFQEEPLTVEKSISGVKMTLTPSQKKVKYLEAKPVDGGLLLLFEGNPKEVAVQSVSEDFGEFKFNHKKYSDSVMVWMKPLLEEQKTSKRIQFSYQTPTLSDTVSTYYQSVKNVEMVIKNDNDDKIIPKKEFQFISNFDIDKIQPSEWVLKKDSTQVVPFEAEINKNNSRKLIVKAEFEDGGKYQLTVPKGSVSSYFETTKKSYRFDFEIDKVENYGSAVFRLVNAPTSKYWIQLLDHAMEVKYQQYTDLKEVKFNLLPAEEYYVRILEDDNGNEFWDAANLEKKVFAEKSYLFYKILNVRPLWEMVEDWDLNSNKILTQKITPPQVKQPKNQKSEKPEDLFKQSDLQNNQINNNQLLR